MQQKLSFWFFLILIVCITYLSLVKEQWIADSLAKERISSYAMLGESSARFAEVRAYNAFTKIFTNTGIVDTTYEIVTFRSTDESTAIDKAGGTVLAWFEGRVRTVWLLAFQFMTRISTALMWWPFAILCLTPFLVDALVRRSVNANSFGHTSPHLQAIASRLILVAAVCFPMLLFAPFALPAAFMPGLILILSACMWSSIAHFAKRM